MPTVTSRDGTTIAFDQSGSGPALILVPGMFEQRADASTDTAQLAAYAPLAERFTVYHYDRRGRGGRRDGRGEHHETAARAGRIALRRSHDAR